MKLVIDTDKKLIIYKVNGKFRKIKLYSKKAFELISQQWLKTGWSQKYTYSFTWLGRPIIQLPEDMIRIQEVTFQLKPDVIIETGIAHGGSLVYYAGLCKLIGKGRVIGIDIEIRPHNRKAIESHELFPFITLIEGSSVNPKVVEKVKKMLKPKESVLVILDSCHTKKHVLEELETYGFFVTPGSFIVVCDGILKELADVPRGYDYLAKGTPIDAINEFLKRHHDFVLERPIWPFNESRLTENITHWPNAWLKRKK